jgi:hypothetical protein
MQQEMALARERLTTPRAAAVAGILFSILLIGSLVLINIAIPEDRRNARTWLSGNWNTIRLALNLLPFAGIAFLWFIGVVRDLLGEYEDRFFATVFLGSGLLFLAMLFTSAAVVGGIMIAYNAAPTVLDSSVYTFARSITHVILFTYAIKMGGVFMISTSTLFIRTRVMPRWMAWLGYGVALLLLLTISEVGWVGLLFPLWILLISVHILAVNLRRKSGLNDVGML